MIDLGASMTVMPKKVFDFIGLAYIRDFIRVLQLDGTNFKTLGIVKDVSLKLHRCSGILVIQDIIVVDIPPMFGLCLSR